VRFAFVWFELDNGHQSELLQSDTVQTESFRKKSIVYDFIAIAISTTSARQQYRKSLNHALEILTSVEIGAPALTQP
jgi:hypothetical protein